MGRELNHRTGGSVRRIIGRSIIDCQKAEEALRRMGHSVGLRVSDRGRGFGPQECRDTAGFGLLSIRERVELLGGRVKIASAKGRGTKVWIVVPDARPDQGAAT